MKDERPRGVRLRAQHWARFWFAIGTTLVLSCLMASWFTRKDYYEALMWVNVVSLLLNVRKDWRDY